MTDLYLRIYDIVRKIPSGRATSYGAIAKFIGSPKGARMVGWAMNQSHSFSEFMPAHRVVNRFGMLSGKHHFPGKNIMQELLENEGIVIIDDQIQDFENVFWDPMKELDMDFI
ncbi:MGMT family protein [Ancylomarina longa]|uniref:MGMT family protein n=1 Tax=Ancylomarina longa TaxID=2487017 RepID=A0A434AUH7_9BACT|nr:MGMT family protein [Ancylomarina longa]RUT77996.1 MGMT family protein [Ancylomarina longa]